MEIDITAFFNSACPRDYSASVAEIGNHAGAYTWAAANDDSSDYMMLDSDDKREAFRAYVQEFGAWSEEEITAWSDIELNALFIQFVSGDMREGSLDAEVVDWADYYAQSEQGGISGRLFKGMDDKVYYLIG